MYKALAIKELRETAWLAALALVAYTLILFKLTGYDLWGRWEPVSSVPFDDGKITFWSGVVAALFGMVLGIRQTWWESLRGTSVFLLHRPISRRALIATKLIMGGLLFLVATGLPLVIYSLWAAQPGTHASPFFWSMTGTCWWFWFAFPMVYAAAFLTGLRDALVREPSLPAGGRVVITGFDCRTVWGGSTVGDTCRRCNSGCVHLLGGRGPRLSVKLGANER